MSESEWRQVDEYYWQGPPGWTICRVWVNGGYQHELWLSRGDTCRLVGSRSSLAAAVELFEQQPKG